MMKLNKSTAVNSIAKIKSSKSLNIFEQIGQRFTKLIEMPERADPVGYTAKYQITSKI